MGEDRNGVATAPVPAPAPASASASASTVPWNGGLQEEALELLRAEGGIVVSPTKVGYVILAADRRGLERKFEVKNRPRTNPGVVLCGSLEELVELAEIHEEALGLYRAHDAEDILLGCILPWRSEGRALIPEGAEPYLMDARGTSCFVIRFGVPGEAIARSLWDEERRLLFASSANPSGQGNRGVVEGIGERIAGGVDLVVESDAYVRSMQPEADERTRHEQGVMVSFVDEEGRLVPEQHGARRVSPVPTLIRGGLSADRIMHHLAQRFPSWDYRHGQYH
ncbi:L-threonylcarbamoyladenylate synthase [Rothia halotolerans]|uniref:L-threonylcarbamoyladenylate synthase n=1 Tax=Rothia halotolerans TaxID=405770 RepID=UPI00101D520F|nr:Sua5/YciO/YrdC/YwlC family protein [Rothia halotolerans]